MKASLEESRLEYHPFILKGNELIHTSLRAALDRTALTYGIRM